jgi:hypothetical protein
MRDLIICDNFYNNPDEVRNFALQQPFEVKGNYPGNRTKSHLTQEIADWISKVVGGEFVMEGLGDSTYCGAYQYTTASDRTWIHADGWNDWAGVVYLTPDAPVTGGTGLYRHKESGLYNMPEDEALQKSIEADGNDYTKWDLVDVVGNRFNRAVFYRGNAFHASLDYFGKNLQDGRLFQTFFFNTK